MGTTPFQLGPTDSAKPMLSALLKELEMARRFTVSVARDLTAEELAARPVAGKNWSNRAPFYSTQRTSTTTGST